MTVLQNDHDHLRDSLRRWSHQWESTRDGWKDSKRDEFNRDYAVPLNEHTQKALRSLEALIEVVEAATLDLR